MPRFGKSKKGSKGRAYPKFVPTKAQRKLVSQLIAMHCSWDEIRELVINPATGNPICKEMLSRNFKRELAVGGVELKRLGTSKYFEALKRGKDWAVKWTLRNRFGWVGEGSLPVPVEMIGQAGDEFMQIRFVNGPGNKPEPVDITPPAPTPSPYEGQPADLSRPAIEAPRPRFRTGTGAIFEAPPKPGDWMK
jgi:hypothetical protein